VPIVLEQANAQFDDLVAIRVGAGCLDIHNGGDKIWNIVG